jgi:sulfite reductase (NADPH) flavoprotein alpha-component
MIPVLPESAPFTPAQRAWLNGYFAGLLSSHGGAPAAPPVPLPGATAAATPTAPAEPWHDPGLSLDARLALSQGQPLASRLMSAMAQLDCNACGYDCRSYGAALASGAERKVSLCSPGGGATAATLKELLAAPRAAPAAASPQPAPGPAPAPAVASPQPAAKPAALAAVAAARAGRVAFRARLLARDVLHGPGATAPVVNLVLDAGEAGEPFEPGDSFGVFPENSAEAVEGALAALRATGRERILGPAGREGPLRVVLAEDCDLRDLDEVLAQLPPRWPPLQDIVRNLGRLKPRLYTLASSPRLHPGEAHLTVAVAPGGFASTWLAQRLPIGGTLRLFVNRGRLRLPPGSGAPVIMIGASAGIAPFRAFLQERKASGASSWSWLLFGGERQADDLYQREMDEFLAAGVLTRLDKAFPGDATPGVKLADRVVQNGAELWSWLEQGAHLYVSGDAKRMAPEVDAALRSVVAEHGKRSPEEAKGFLASLAKDKRYLREIY